jgi:hypothetical protein
VNTLSATTSVLLAHQGGWDEILLIGGPIVIIMGLLWLAKRRVDHAASLHGPGGVHSSPGSGHSPADSD